MAVLPPSTGFQLLLGNDRDRVIQTLPREGQGLERSLGLQPRVQGPCTPDSAKNGNALENEDAVWLSKLTNHTRAESEMNKRVQGCLVTVTPGDAADAPA